MTKPTELVPVKFGDYLELTKPRLSLLSVFTVLVAYVAARPAPEALRTALLIVGTVLAAGGVAALNQWMEFDVDARMQRTSDRPIPAGKIPDGSAFVMGMLMCIAALFLLFATVNPLSALFTLLTIVSYLCWYTPAKRWSRWSTEIGALAGAFPPLIGWAAGEGRITGLGWILFGMLFFWQIPHFMAVAWIYRKDYSLVQFPMLPVRDESGVWVSRWSLACTAALVAVSLLPVAYHLTSRIYGGAAVVGGVFFLWRAGRFLRADGRDLAARKLFLASITYLPLLLIVLVIDRLLFAS